MRYLYGYKSDVGPKLLATFDSEEQLRAYVRWATLKTEPNGDCKFEQGSALAGGYHRWQDSAVALSEESEDEVLHNPTPTML